MLNNNLHSVCYDFIFYKYTKSDFSVDIIYDSRDEEDGYRCFQGLDAPLRMNVSTDEGLGNHLSPNSQFDDSSFDPGHASTPQHQER